MNFGLFSLIMLTAAVAALIGVSAPSPVAFAQEDTDEEELEFGTNLTGQAVIPPPVVTNASATGQAFIPSQVVSNGSGEAIFTLSEAGDEMAYELEVQGIPDVVNVHMHVGNSTRNGPIVVTLYNIQTSEPVDESGSLASGEFASDDFERILPRVQNMTNLVDLIEEGKIYVDVHTLTYPRGELRGTVELREESS